jgi:hypothetical protein
MANSRTRSRWTQEQLDELTNLVEEFAEERKLFQKSRNLNYKDWWETIARRLNDAFPDLPPKTGSACQTMECHQRNGKLNVQPETKDEPEEAKESEQAPTSSVDLEALADDLKRQVRANTQAIQNLEATASAILEAIQKFQAWMGDEPLTAEVQTIESEADDEAVAA